MNARTARTLAVTAIVSTLALGNAATALAGAATPAKPSQLASRAGATPSPRERRTAGGGTVRYARFRHLCDQPSDPAVASCLAIQKVDVKPGTRGAVPYIQPRSARPDGLGTGPASGYTPAELAHAYGIDPNAATTQTIAIIDAHDDPYALSELNAFDQQYGLPSETATSFRKLNQRGAPSPLPAADAGWSGEIALDIEAVRGLCHHCGIDLIEADSAFSKDLAGAVDTAVRLKAGIVSNSYGAPEAGSTSTIARSYDHPGTVIVASTGDHGWYDWDFVNNVTNDPSTTGASDNMPNTPAAYPGVVAVAGTELALDAGGNRQDEAVWNENGPDDVNGILQGIPNGAQGASGGGCSLAFPAPEWQRSAQGYDSLGCGGGRSTGDIAALADPVSGFDVFSHYADGWVTTGGTSLASPIIAALFGLAGGAHGVDYPAKTLYTNYAHRPGALYDVVEGGNAFCAGDSKASCSQTVSAETNPPTGNPNNIGNGSDQHPGTPHGTGWSGLLDCGYSYDLGEGYLANDHQCNAAPGFDGPSGVGVPQGLGAFTPTAPRVSVSGRLPARVHTATTFTATVAEPISGARPTTWTWSWGDGSTSPAGTPSTQHVYSHAGTYTVTVTVTDSLGQQGTAHETVTLGRAPSVRYRGPGSLHHGARGHLHRRGIVRREHRRPDRLGHLELG